MFMGYSTQHAGDVYRFLHMKTSYIMYSQDVEWLGKLWHEFYRILSTHSADKYVDPFDNYIEETDTNQEVENKVQEAGQMPPIIKDTNEKEDEPIATRT